jgi:hypothetical protein
MKEKDMEQLLKTADFSAGSDHKERLRKELFGAAEELSDDELDLAAGGVRPSRRLVRTDKKGRTET